jgi:DNA mismatch repair protein MutL
MSRIKILPDKIVNLIAAGEVVDRPSSVVKELIENAIDAGATQITVETKGDGRQLIRVSDDGMGISEEDVALAFERHATSKIASAEDLDRIATMGFRGEALSSIASVSEVEIVTRTRTDEVATRLVVRGGRVEDTSQTSRSPGTTVSAANLFYNAPARAKFLKTKATELRHITRTFAQHAMTQYGISMKLIRDRRVILSLPAVDSIEERIRGILGSNFGENSMAVDVADEHIQVCGFLSRPEEARTSSGYTSIFVNARPVESRLILRAVCDAYGNTLKSNRYPTGVILVRIDPGEVDFNVHPTKKQVRFRNEGDVRRFVFRAVQSALQSRRMVPPLIGRQHRSAPPKRDARAGRIPLMSKQEIFVQETPKQYRPAVRPKSDAEVTAIAQIKNSYILAESEMEFYLIDQHAAHERVLYEEIKTNLEGREAVSQNLLFPESVHVTPEEEDLIDEHLEAIKKMGFDIRKFGRRTYVVEAVPALLKASLQKTILNEMVDEVLATRAESDDMYHLLAAGFACRGAIKAGDKQSPAEIQALLDQLFKSKMPFACPHGRPTMIRLSWEEIERRFLRR